MEELRSHGVDVVYTQTPLEADGLEEVHGGRLRRGRVRRATDEAVLTHRTPVATGQNLTAHPLPYHLTGP